MKIFNRIKLKPELVFLGVLLICGFIYNYHGIAPLKPVGIHQWRNSVSAAFPVNYYYGGHFFTTQTNAMLGDNGTSDIAVVEFPLLYYIISLLYRVFGVNELWFRLFQVFIGFVGLICLFRVSYFFTGDWFYAGFIPMIIFTSPIYVYYLNNFLPDAVTLSLTFAGFYYYIKHSSNGLFRTWLLAMLFFLLAGLTKTSSLLPYFALGAVALIQLIRGRGSAGQTVRFRYEFKYIASFAGILVLIFGWYLYARLYTDVHLAKISIVQIRPVWNLERDEIREVLEGMKYWFIKGDYHQMVFLVSSLAVFIATLFFYRKANRFLYTFNIMIFLGAVSFAILFFKSLGNHDYYLINNLFLFVTIYLTLLSVLSNLAPRIYRSVWTKLACTLLVAFLVWKCQNRMDFRYSEKDYHYITSMERLRLYDIEDYLEELGIGRDDMVYCTPDGSVNISLYLCNRKGLTDFSAFWNLSLEERLERMKEMGIGYVILGSREHYAQVENLDEILGKKIGQTGHTEIFKLEER